MVTVAVYTVLDARLAAGVNVATEPAATYVTAPVTPTPPGPVNMKVVASIVAGFIASLKVALSTWLMGTPVAPLTGMVEITVGGVVSGAVRGGEGPHVVAGQRIAGQVCLSGGDRGGVGSVVCQRG